MDTKLEREVTQAVHTVLHEIPNAHPDDVADAVCGIIGFAAWDANEAEILAMIKRYR